MRTAGRAHDALWLGAAALACLWVTLANGGPLYYFDTAGYVEQGTAALRQLGLIAPEPVVAAGGGTAGSVAGAATVDGSRSAVYAVLSGLLVWFGSLDALVLVNVVAVMVALWLPVRVAVRESLMADDAARGVALPVIVAALGSLPFYVAYLMPDIFAAILLMTGATLAAFGRRMFRWELALALLLGLFAVVSHLSHLAIALLLVPVVAVAALAQGRHRWWVGPLAMTFIVAGGFAEQKAFRAAAKALEGAEVIIKPYITARLIQDGPGYGYLSRHCPDAAIPTCALWAALQKSDNPRRLTATHIVFENSPDLGSFRLLDPADQARVADGQIRFFLDVLGDAPVATVLAFARNMAIQTGMISVDMTLPTAQIDVANAAISGGWTGPLTDGNLRADASWLGPLTLMQGVLYALSGLVVAALVVLPGRVATAWRIFALVLVAGILANALVCGGISQPATRYGARVIWLMPMLAALLSMAAASKRKGGLA